MGGNQCLDDEDYFTGKLERTFSAKVITDKCTIFVINKDILNYFMSYEDSIK